MKSLSSLSIYRKAIAAAIAGLTVLGAALADGSVTGSEWLSILGAAVGAVGVYAVRNDAPSE